MTTKEEREDEEEIAVSPEDEAKIRDADDGWMDFDFGRPPDIYVEPPSSPPPAKLKFPSAPVVGEAKPLRAKIDDALRQIEEVHRETHAHDEEIARLGEETRRLIDEMLRALNLKAA